ncbi:tyrosine kinase family protein [Mycobacterium kansasii]|uniref:non-specific serine/threonine protein kinase n=1 Tax=Mycobacterium kansasii TaxID=1768 RepID=A0A1V3WE53_MYCKA|nr:tyrosine kinase family protein [Mycobacterium kansasii]
MLVEGSVVCGYRIQRMLGSGGMGAVYLADDPALPRAVALKVLSAELCRDPDFRARFIREADTAASLEHPQIVSVYTRGQTDDGQLWIAMQFVDGTDADAALRAGAMTPIGPCTSSPKSAKHSTSPTPTTSSTATSNPPTSCSPGPGQRRTGLPR